MRKVLICRTSTPTRRSSKRGLRFRVLVSRFRVSVLPRQSKRLTPSRSFDINSITASHSHCQILIPGAHRTEYSHDTHLHCLMTLLDSQRLCELRPPPSNIITNRFIARFINKESSLTLILPHQHTQLFRIVPDLLKVKLTCEIRKQRT